MIVAFKEVIFTNLHTNLDIVCDHPNRGEIQGAQIW